MRWWLVFLSLLHVTADCILLAIFFAQVPAKPVPAVFLSDACVSEFRPTGTGHDSGVGHHHVTNTQNDPARGSRFDLSG